MAVFDQPVTTYSDTTPHRQVITDVISLIDPVDTPLIDQLGGLDGASGKFRFVNGPGKKVEWLEDTHAPLSDTLNHSANLASTTVTITVTDASLYQPGMIIAVASEQMWVSAVDTAAETIVVTRGVGGTTAATQSSVGAVTFVGMARLEGDDSDPIALTDRYTGSNVTQIFHREVKVTRSQQKLSQYGISDEMAYQKDKAVPELMVLLEKHLVHNKGASAGSATTPRIMGGIQAFVTTNLVSGASLAKSAFETAMLAQYNAGGSGQYVAVMTPANAQKIVAFYEVLSGTANSILRVDRSETVVGMQVTKIISEYGECTILKDRHIPSTIIPILDMEHAGILTYDPLAWEDLAKTGDYSRAEVVGEFTFCLRQEKAHAILTAVS